MSQVFALVDSHCHFDFAAFDEDRAAVWQASNAAGVRQLVIPGVAPDQWQKAVDVCRLYPGLYCAAGIHPWWVKNLFDDAASLEDLRRQLHQALTHTACVAVGECGLDAVVEGDFQQQVQVFTMQLALASELKLPLIIHCRKAHNEVLALLKQYQLPAGGVIHAFSGSHQLAQTYIDLGFCLGIGGTITYERAHKTRDAVRHVSLAALLLESDAPDMPLSGRQGQRNSPHYLPETAQTLARLRGQSIADVARQTSENSRRLFNLP